MASFVTLKPGKYDFEDVHVDFGLPPDGQMHDIQSDKWVIMGEESDKVEEWAIKTTMSGEWAFSSLISTVDFQVHGEVATTEDVDAFFGFGTGSKHVSLMVDFDGKVGAVETGIQIYPACGGALATGDIANVLDGASSLDDHAAWQTRLALSGGNLNNWEQMGGSRHDNGKNTWPVAIEVENDFVHGRVIVRFESETQSLDCVYNDTFDTDSDLVFGINPDSNEDGSGKDKINVHFITVAKSEVDVCGQHCDASDYAPIFAPINVDAPENGLWSVELSGKDLLIVALCAINAVVLIAVMCSCSRFGGAGPQRKKYQVVSVNGDSEMEQFQH